MNIKIYWSDHCNQCKTALRYFDEKGVPIERINVSHDQEKFDEMLQQGGIATPLIVVDQQVIHSFDRQKLNQLLEGFA